MSAARKSARKPDNGRATARKRLIGAVHSRASRIGLSDEDRRALQQQLTGTSSLAEMTNDQIGRVLDYLHSKSNIDKAQAAAHLRKIKALWLTLYWLGEVRSADDRAINAFVSRFGLSALRFVDHRTGHQIIEALKDMGSRAGVIWADAKQRGGPTALHLLNRHAVLEAQWQALNRLGFVTNFDHYRLYLAKALGIRASNYLLWAAPLLDQGIKLLGAKLRALRAVADA